MKSLTVDYTPKPKQALFHQSAAEECLFGGAKSPGKSCAEVMEAAAYAFQYPGSTPYLFRETYDQLEANLIAEFFKRIPKEAYHWDGSKHTAHLPNGSKVKFRYIASLRDAYRYNGRSIPWIGVDELTEHMEDTIRILLSCLRSAEGFPVRFRGTANPGGIGHTWVMKRYIKGTDYGQKIYVDKDTGNRIQYIPATVYDGVLAERDPNYVRRLENLPETEKQAYLYGNWNILVGQFFPEFGDHLQEQPFMISAHECNLYGSLDYGEGDGPKAGATSFGLWHVDRAGRSHRLYTYYKRNQSAGLYAREIVAAIKSFHWTNGIMPKTVHADPSLFIKRKQDDDNTFSIADIFAQYGLVLTPANNERVNGWRVMRYAFCLDETGTPRSYYWDGYNAEYEAYIKDLVRSKINPNDVDTRGEDHTADEARYHFVAAMGQKAVDPDEKAKRGRRIQLEAANFNRIYENSPMGAFV